MEDNIVKIVKGRVKENKILFKKEEYIIIEENMNIVKQIYLLGYLDARSIYNKI